ncbi:response regulator [Roseateles sp.]|uniref:response regulator transcription factor n=1 Tax=Roseateles sp. TaxID=1971397 RepID=UPI0031DE33D0
MSISPSAVMADPDAPVASALPAAAVAAATTIVAVVDDDPFVRAATGSLVRAFGWEAHTFCSAEDYLASGLAARTACLVCDIQMERLDGIGLLARLQKDGVAPPTLFITALTSETVRRRALGQGALHVIDKPIDANELEEWVQRALASGPRGRASGG